MIIAASLLAGLIFGLGLIVSGMANPAKVLAFLDLAGGWDPSLIAVMAGALAVGIVPFTIARRRTASLLGAEMKLPAPSNRIDRRLIGGSLLFGIGWGVAGFCPGPAIVALGFFNSHEEAKTLVFAAAMLSGMGLFECIERWRAPSPMT